MSKNRQNDQHTQGVSGKNDIQFIPVEPSSVLTGDVNRGRQLYYQLISSMHQAERIDMIVSFLMEKGVRMLLRDLRFAVEREVPVRILTGRYLGITQPTALYLLKNEFGDKIDLRFYDEEKRSFHPKAYFFHGKEGSHVYIGSSNLSRSALTEGIEWNYRLQSSVDKENYQRFADTFEDLFKNHSIKVTDEVLREYSKNWRKPAIQKDWERHGVKEEEPDTDEWHGVRAEEADIEESHGVGAEAQDTEERQIGTGSASYADTDLYKPRGAQIEALYELAKTREDGADKALIYAATGVGKTLLAAFDSKSYSHVLFVAHREEILLQTAESFRHVRHSMDYGFFQASRKDTDKAMIFASVSSLGKSEYLQEKYFAPDYFDYIVIDEFHHAVNDCYLRIMEYFHPKFLLGLTATPERMDRRNIYALCDYNVPYQISLKQAINKGLLVPFHYYGIYDWTVDYTRVHRERGKYDADELAEIYRNNVWRYDLIYSHYRKYHAKRVLGFCCSREHAEKMAEEFCRRGTPAVAVYSNADGGYSENRKAAIERLKKGEIQVIFSVDMFNEGVDIQEVDMVMFLRPTESPTVFLQQLGRGLRKCEGKDYLDVLDFIGNYEKAGNTPFLLSGLPYSRAAAMGAVQQNFDFPDDCVVDFDFRLIDLFQEMAKKNATIRQRIQDEYLRVKELLGKVPSRIELFNCMEDEVYQLALGHPQESPFRNYLGFLQELGELNAEEEALQDGVGGDFLHELEITNMTKSYKMPVLAAFYHDGEIRMAIGEEDVYRYYKRFYDSDGNWKDMLKDKGTCDYRSWDRRRFISEAKKNPVKFLLKSGKGFFVEKEGYVLALNDCLGEIVKNPAFVKHMGDIIEYRTMEYYRKRFEEKLE